jgi:hypothetical protein
MKKLALIGSALLLSSTAMAADFQALSVLGSTPVQLQDSELATTEGGAFCMVPDASAGNGNAGGVALCGEIGGAQGAHFSVANDAPVTGANFLQVTGGL